MISSSAAATGSTALCWSVTLMSRLDCSLCATFETALADSALTRGRYHLTIVNVDSSPEFLARYGLRVPVLLDGAREICAFRFREDKLAVLLGRG